MSRDEKKHLKMPSKRLLIIVGIIVVIGFIIWLVLGQGLVGSIGKNNIDFKELSKEDIPKSIETEVIPEYRDLERALGCLIDGKVYVVVTRGEKPTAGYEITIKNMSLEKKDGKGNLKVEAMFKEPKEGVAVAQIITYPYAVASTNLTLLPDTIELIVKYEE